MFGSYRVADLLKAPPEVNASAVAIAARNAELANLQLLQTVQGQALYSITQKLQRLGASAKAAPTEAMKRTYTDQIAALGPEALRLYKNWKTADYGRAVVKSPSAANAAVPGLTKIIQGVPGTPGVEKELSGLVNKSLPLPGNIAGGLFGMGMDAILGCSTGRCPDGQDLANSAIGNFVAPAASTDYR